MELYLIQLGFSGMIWALVGVIVYWEYSRGKVWEEKVQSSAIEKGEPLLDLEALNWSCIGLGLLLLFLLNLIPAIGMLFTLPGLAALYSDSSIYNTNYRLYLQFQKEKKQQVKDNEEENRFILRMLRKYPNLYEQILADPSHAYHAQVKQLQGEGKASICIKDKTITLDGKVYRLEKVDMS